MVSAKNVRLGDRRAECPANEHVYFAFTS